MGEAPQLDCGIADIAESKLWGRGWRMSGPGTVSVCLTSMKHLMLSSGGWVCDKRAREKLPSSRKQCHLGHLGGLRDMDRAKGDCHVI